MALCIYILLFNVGKGQDTTQIDKEKGRKVARMQTLRQTEGNDGPKTIAVSISIMLSLLLNRLVQYN